MKPRRLIGIGLLYEAPGEGTSRPRRVVEVTRSFAEQWDHDILNQAYLGRDVTAAVAAKARLPNGYSVVLSYQGRVFCTLYPSSEVLS